MPGSGHALLRRWPKALGFFLAAAGLAIAGCELRGEIFFVAFGRHVLDRSDLIADAGSGIFYFAARILEATGPDISRAAGDYGTRFIAAAGIVNLLGVLVVLMESRAAAERLKASRSWMHLNHLFSMILFAALVSLGAGVRADERTITERVKYALWLLALFVAVGAGNCVGDVSVLAIENREQN